jgi:hypothetical protein
MQITFADGTRIEVTESALDDFVRHDLKWAEFVHGSASLHSGPIGKSGSLPVKSASAKVRRCPSPSQHGC